MRTKRGMFVRLLVLVVPLVLGVLGVLLGGACGGKGARPGRPSRHAVFEDQRPVTSPVLAWLPADTSMVLIADRVDRLARELGWDEVAALQPEAHGRAVAGVEELFGHNLLDPGALGQVGLDASRPWGVAYLDPETLVLFLPLSDPARFEQAVIAQAPLWNQEVQARGLGPARVLGPPYEDAWRMVLRERMALWILALDDARAGAAAQALATAGGGPSLAGNPAFTRAMGELAYGPDMAGYVSGALLASGGLGLGNAGLAFGVDLGRDEIRVRATVPVQAGGPLDRLLRAPASTPALLGTLSERPLGLLDAVVNGEALAELPPARDLGGIIEVATGVSLARDLAPLLAGEIGVAILPGPPPAAGSATGPRAAAGAAMPVVHFLAELRDPAQGKALLERAMTGGPWAGQAHAAGPGVYRVARPGGAVVHVGVTGPWLWVSTGWTPEILPALGAGNAQAFEMALGPGTLARLLLGPGQAALRASVDARLLGDWFLVGRVDTSFLQTRLAELESGYQPSEAFRRKRAELEAAQRELEALENAAIARSSQRAHALLDAVGTLALRVDPDREAGRLVVHAAEIAGPGGVPAVIGELMALLALPAQRDPAEDEALSRARARVWQLLEELAAIRRSETGEPAPGPGQQQLPEPPSEPVPRPGRPGLSRVRAP
jgi:hypothetical protein